MNNAPLINTINSNIFNITSSLSIDFVVILVLGIVLITCLGAYLNYKKYKWYHPRFLIYFSTILAAIIGLVFASFNDFKPLSETSDEWLRQAILFVAAIGNFYMMLLFVAIIIVAPINIIYNLKKWMSHPHPLKSFWKLSYYFIIFSAITLCATQLLWILPGFAYDSTANFATVGNNPINNNMSWFYFTSRWLFDNVIYTQWFAWGFILYLVLCIMIASIVVFCTRYNNHFSANYWKDKRIKIEKPTFFVHFLSFMAFIFILQNIMMNPLGLVFHLIDIIIILAATTILIMFVISILGSIKSRRSYFYYVKLMWYVYIKTIKSTDTEKSLAKLKEVDASQQRLKMCSLDKINSSNVNFYGIASNYIFPIVFTVYLGFVNNYNFETTSFEIVNHWQFWITMIIGTYLSSLIFSNSHYNNTILNNGSALAAFSITAGVQTGVFNVYTKVLAHMRSVIALQVIVYETMDPKKMPQTRWVT